MTLSLTMQCVGPRFLKLLVLMFVVPSVLLKEEPDLFISFLNVLPMLHGIPHIRYHGMAYHIQGQKGTCSKRRPLYVGPSFYVYSQSTPNYVTEPI